MLSMGQKPPTSATGTGVELLMKPVERDAAALAAPCSRRSPINFLRSAASLQVRLLT